jgi:nucleoside-diphosphate-sugar epimerase
VQGIVRCVARPEARNQIFNLTYGGARTLNQMADIMKTHFPGIEVEYKPRDLLMPERGTLSIEKARRLLGYEPQYPLDNGFVRYIEWYKDLALRHPELFHG